MNGYRDENNEWEDGGQRNKFLVELPFYACGSPHGRCLSGRTASHIGNSEKAESHFLRLITREPACDLCQPVKHTHLRFWKEVCSTKMKGLRRNHFEGGITGPGEQKLQYKLQCPGSCARAVMLSEAPRFSDSIMESSLDVFSCVTLLLFWLLPSLRQCCPFLSLGLGLLDIFKRFPTST